MTLKINSDLNKPFRFYCLQIKTMRHTRFFLFNISKVNKDTWWFKGDIYPECLQMVTVALGKTSCRFYYRREDLFKCGKCKQAYYCNVDCQVRVFLFSLLLLCLCFWKYIRESKFLIMWDSLKLLDSSLLLFAFPERWLVHAQDGMFSHVCLWRKLVSIRNGQAGCKNYLETGELFFPL